MAMKPVGAATSMFSSIWTYFCQYMTKWTLCKSDDGPVLLTKIFVFHHLSKVEESDEHAAAENHCS